MDPPPGAGHGFERLPSPSSAAAYYKHPPAAAAAMELRFDHCRCKHMVAVEVGGRVLYLSTGEAFSVPAASMGRCSLFDPQRQLHTQVADAGILNRVPPAAGAACMHHGHFTHSVLIETPKPERPATCELCKIAGEGLAGYSLSTGEASEAPTVLVADAASATPRTRVGTYCAVTPDVHPRKNKRLAEITEELEVKETQVFKTGAAQGEVTVCKGCNLVFNGERVKSSHINGKKHKFNEHGHPAVTLAVHQESCQEYLEAKKKRVLDHGAAQGEVRICKVCNVVVNSQAVYLSHISGRRHKANVRKQQYVHRRHIARDKECI